MLRKSSNPQSEANDTLELGGQTITIKPLGFEAGIKLCMLLAPYIPKLRTIYEFMVETDDPDASVKRIRDLVNEMVNFPGDLVKMVSLLIDRDPRWVAKTLNGEEIISTLIEFERAFNVTQILMTGVKLSLLDWSSLDERRTT